MPEGPEVAVYADYIRACILDKYICGIAITRYNRSNKDSFESTKKFPSKVIEVVSSAKKIFIITEDYVLQSSLIMTGSWGYGESKHNRLYLIIGTYHGNSFVRERNFHFRDVDGKGWLHMLSLSEYSTKRKKSPPCLMNDEVSLETFQSCLMKVQHQMIGIAIHDAKVIGGIGNYLRAEILYDAGISPRRYVHSLLDEEWEKLWESSIRIIKESYRSYGCEIRDYKSPIEKGTFQLQIKVYGKKGNGVIAEKIDGDGQTMYWNPQVQK